MFRRFVAGRTGSRGAVLTRPAADAAPRGCVAEFLEERLLMACCFYSREKHVAILSAAPHASVALWNAVKTGDHARALDLHRRILTLWNAIVSDNLPACTRVAQSLQGLPNTFSRAPMPEASNAQQGAIARALEGLGSIGGKRVEAAE